MPSPSDLLRYQIRFTTWATKRVLNAASSLTPEELDRDFATADKSVRGTLVHIYRSERIWLARLEGRSSPYVLEGDDKLSDMVENWTELRGQWQNWSNLLTDAGCDATLSYRDLRDNAWTSTLSEIVLHVVNHSTHHRGQVCGFLRSMGKTPPSVDSIAFARGVA